MMGTITFAIFVMVSLISHCSTFRTTQVNGRAFKWFNRGIHQSRSSFSLNIAPLEAQLGLSLSVESLSKLRPMTAPLISIDGPRVIPPTPASGGDDGKWRLWFHGRDTAMKNDVIDQGTGKVYYLTSDDGVTNWKCNSDDFVALKSGRETGDWWWFDSEHIGVGDIIKPGSISIDNSNSQGSMFLMYTFGGNSDANAQNIKGMKLEIGVCISQDGVNWSKVEGPSPYGSILEIGSTGQFDSLFLGWPSVVEVGLQYFMYYHTYNAFTKRYIVGIATAADGLLKWTKRGPVFQGGADDQFDGAGVTRRHVVKLSNGSFRMWYEGVSRSGVHSIGLAVSPNGIEWERVSDEPVFAPSDDSTAWDSGSVGSPHLIWIAESKRWRMYYSGKSLHDYSLSGGEENSGGSAGGWGIGIAESLDEEGIYFKRVSFAEKGTK